MRFSLALALVLAGASCSGQTSRACFTNGEDDRLVEVPCSMLPPHYSKSSEWRTVVVPERRVGFWTVRPGRASRETLRSPWFLVPHALAAIATTVAYRRSKGESAADAFVPLAAVTGLDYAADRFLWRPLSVGAAGYTVGLYTYGAATRTFH